MTVWESRRTAARELFEGLTKDLESAYPHLSEALTQLWDGLDSMFYEFEKAPRGEWQDPKLFEKRMLEWLQGFVVVVEPFHGSFEWALRKMRNENARVTHPALGAVYRRDHASGDIITASGPLMALDPLSDKQTIPAFGWVEVPK